jgi:PST family polysaccharide transporter
MPPGAAEPSRLRSLLYGDLQLMMLGNFLEAGMRFVAFLVYSWEIGPSGVGIVVSVLALTRLSSQLLDFGVDTSVISLGSKAFGRGDLAETARICGAGFNLHLWIGLALVALGATMSPLLADRYFDRPELAALLALAFAGVLVERLADFNLSVLRTYQRFRSFAAAGALSALFLLVAVTGLAWLGRLDVTAVVLLTMVLLPLARFAVSWPALPAKALRPGRIPRDVLSRVLGFGKWIYGSGLAESGMRRINVLLVQGLTGDAAAGYFHTAMRYADFLSLIFDPMRKYLAPKLTALSGRSRIREALGRTYGWLAWTLLFIPAAWLASSPLFTRLQGEDWLPAVPIFRVLVVAILISFLTRPLYFAMFSVGRPQLQTWIQVALAVAFVPGAWWAIREWGALGSAWAILCMTLAGLVAAATGAWHALRPSADDDAAGPVTPSEPAL